MKLQATFKSILELELALEAAKKNIPYFVAVWIMHGLPPGCPEDENIRRFRAAWQAYKERQ